MSDQIVEKLNASLKLKEAEIVSLKKDIKRLKNAASSLRNKYASILKRSKNPDSNDATIDKEQFESFKIRVQELASRMELKGAECNRLESVMSEKDKEINRLQNSERSLSAIINTQKEQIDARKVQESTQESTNDVQKKDIKIPEKSGGFEAPKTKENKADSVDFFASGFSEELERELSELKKELGEKEEYIIELTEKLEKSMAALEEKIALETEETIQDIDTGDEDQPEEIEEESSDLEEIVIDDFDSSKEELKTLENRNDKLAEENEKLLSELSVKDEKIVELSRDSVDLSSEFEKLDRKYNNLFEEKERLEKRSDSQKDSDIEDLRVAKQILTNERDVYRQELDELEAELMKANEFREKQQENEYEFITLSESSKQKDLAINELQSHVASLVKKLSFFESESTSAKEALVDYKKIVTDRDREIMMLETKIRTIESKDN